MFRSWYNQQIDGKSGDGEIDIEISMEWKIFDTLSSDVISPHDALTYTPEIIYNYNNNNRTVIVNSYHVLYNDKHVNKYASDFESICNTFDQTYFKSGQNYTFTSILTVKWITNTDHDWSNAYVVSTSKSFNMIANNRPQISKYECSAFPNNNSTDALQDWFGFTCQENNNNTNNDTIAVFYNFIKQESNTFLSSEYINMGDGVTEIVYSVFSTGNHNISAIVVNEFDIATCLTLSVSTVMDSDITTSSVREFTDWITDAYDRLLNDSDINFVEVMNVLETVFAISIDYVDSYTYQNDTNANDSGNYSYKLSTSDAKQMAKLQENLLNDAINAIGNYQINTVGEATVALSTLQEISNLSTLIDTDAIFYNNTADVNTTVIYESDIIGDILNVVLTYVLPVLNTSISMPITHDTASDIVRLLSNVQTMRYWTNETQENATTNGQSFVDITQTASSLVLVDSIPGQNYTFKTDKIEVVMAKIRQNNYSICNTHVSDYDMIYLSQEFVDIRSNNGEDYMDCTVMVSNDNVYESRDFITNGSISSWQSYFVLLNVESAQRSPFYDRNITNRKTNSNGNESGVPLGILSECSPIIITFDLLNTTFWQGFGRFDESDSNKSNHENHPFPKCSFFDENKKDFSGEGCYVLSVSARHSNNNDTIDTVECACNHTTYFSVSWEDFVPSIKTTNDIFWAEISFQSLIDYPIGWIVVLSWLGVCGVLMFLFDHTRLRNLRDIEDVPLIVQDTAIFHHVALEGEKLKYRSIKEARLIKDDEMKHAPYIIKLWHLWRISMRNDHVWYGICCRNKGTSFTNKQRILMMMLRLLTTMAVSSVFYGSSNETIVGEITLALYESLLGFIPIFVLKRIIVRRRPTSKELEEYRSKKMNKMKIKLDKHTKSNSKSKIMHLKSNSITFQNSHENNSNVGNDSEIASPNGIQRSSSCTFRTGANGTIEIDMNVNFKENSKIRKKALKELQNLAKLHQKRHDKRKDEKSQIAVSDSKEEKKKDDDSTTRASSTTSENATTTQKAKVSEVLTNVETKDLFQMLRHYSTHQHILPPRSTMNVAEALAQFATADDRTRAQTNGSVNSTMIAHDDSADPKTVELARLEIIGSANTFSHDDKNDYDENSENNYNSNSIEYESGMIMKQPSFLVVDKMSVKVELLDEIRHRLFDKFFKYPSKCRHFATCFAIFWAILCATVTTVWCMWFDYQLVVEITMTEPSICTIDPNYPYANYPLQDRMSYNASQNDVTDRNGSIYPTHQSHMQSSADTFGGNVHASEKFLFTVLLSYFLGVAFWHPLIVAIKSVYKLRKFYKKPQTLNRALLFYDSKNLIDLHEMESATPMSQMTRSRSHSQSQSKSRSVSLD